MRFFGHLLFCFLLFLHQSLIFTQVVKSHQNWNEVEVKIFTDVLKTERVSDESISTLIEVIDFSQMQKVTSFFQDLEIVQQQSETIAADVFFDYVLNKQNIDVEVVMGSQWLNRIIEDTQNWTAIEAQHFLAFLESEGIEFNNILVILKATDYLQLLKANQVTFILEEETASISEKVPQQTRQQTEERLSQAQTASDVFIHFTREQFSRELKQKSQMLEGEAFENAFKKRMGRKDHRNYFAP